MCDLLDEMLGKFIAVIQANWSVCFPQSGAGAGQAVSSEAESDG